MDGRMDGWTDRWTQALWPRPLPQVFRPRPSGPGPLAQAPWPRPFGPGPQAYWARPPGFWPRPSSADLMAKVLYPKPTGPVPLVKINGTKVGGMDGRINNPYILQNTAPLGPLPCSQTIKPKRNWYGKVTADHILSLDNWFLHYF